MLQKYLFLSSITNFIFNYYILFVNNIKIHNQITLSIIKKVIIIMTSFIFFNGEINNLKIIGILFCIRCTILNEFNI